MEIETLATIGGIAILLILSGIFSGSETALTAASHPRMHLLQKRGNRRAAIVTRLFASREKLIGAILLGNNLVNIGAAALATVIATRLFGNVGPGLAVGFLTVLTINLTGHEIGSHRRIISARTSLSDLMWLNLSFIFLTEI